MTEREAFHKAIAENPTDATVRLVFADWLDEQGEHEDAEELRSWVMARDWFAQLCEKHNPPPDRPDPYEERVSVEKLFEVVHQAIASGSDERLWVVCRNNKELRAAILKDETEFWIKASQLTGIHIPNPAKGPYRREGPCSECW